MDTQVFAMLSALLFAERARGIGGASALITALVAAPELHARAHLLLGFADWLAARTARLNAKPCGGGGRSKLAAEAAAAEAAGAARAAGDGAQLLYAALFVAHRDLRADVLHALFSPFEVAK
jgi:hypothetical protein